MTRSPVSAGVVHDLPADFEARLVADPAALARWEDITPLARNEWICWIESVKKAETPSARNTATALANRWTNMSMKAFAAYFSSREVTV